MTPRMWMHAALLALVGASALAAQSLVQFTPPRISRAALPEPPGPHVVGGGEVLIEALVDRSGVLTRPLVLRSTPPYTQLVLDAIPHWRFLPAATTDRNGKVTPAEGSVLIAAVYRPPALFNAPTAGEPPKDVGVPSAEVPFPAGVIAPAYPPKAVNVLFAAVLLEAQLDERGLVRNAVAVSADPGFESAAREALKHWTFRPASFEGRTVPGMAYVLFGFKAPVVVPGRQPSTPRPQPSPPRSSR